MLYKFPIIVIIPESVTVKIESNYIYVTGILGTMKCSFHKSIFLELSDAKSILIYTNLNKIDSMTKALIGTARALIRGMIVGVTIGFIKKLQLIGIGYRVSIANQIVNLVVGFSHFVEYKLPIEVTAFCPSQTEIILKSIDKQLVGQVAADLRSIRPPELFKGKGIRYSEEIVRIKDTKKR